MKTIGLLGGMSWESTLNYYRFINEGVRTRLGGLHSARILMYSVDFHEIEQCMKAGDWESAAMILKDAAYRIAMAGADFLLICTNTVHKLAPQIASAAPVPLIHIADAAGRHVRRLNLRKVGLLGTRFTMEEDFYRGRLRTLHGLTVLVPEKADRILVDRIIFEELCLGRIEPESQREYLRIIRQMADAGAEAVILGCTEIAMLVHQEDTDIPLLDTTEIHAAAAVDAALS